MASKSGGISLSTLIFIGFLFYSFLGDDEEDKVDVSVDEKAPIVSEETKDELKKSIRQAFDDAKKAVSEIAETVEGEMNEPVVEAKEIETLEEEAPEVIDEPKEDTNDWKSL